MPLKSFRIENQKVLSLAECKSVPPIMIIAGINGSGKSTLLYSIKTSRGTIEHTGKYLYIPPHRVWTRQAIKARSLWEERRSYLDATSMDSLAGTEGVRITSPSRTADTLDEATNFIKFSLSQIEVQRGKAMVTRFDNREKSDELDFPDVYQPLKDLTRALLPHLEFLRVDLVDMNNVKCVWKRAEGIDLSVGTTTEVDIDDLSSGEKEIFTLFMPFIENQIEKKLLELRNQANNETPSDITVLIDEPELHLHPILEYRVLNYLRKIVSEGGVQFVVTTHSPTLLNSANFDELYLLSPKTDSITNQLTRLTNDEERLQALRILCGETYPITAGRNLLCIEGELPEDLPTKPPDKKLYEILCPELSKNVLLPLGGKNSVLDGARRLREIIPRNIPGIDVLALIDRDQDPERNEEWVFRLPVCMIENILLKPKAINEFLEPYREKTELKTEQHVEEKLKKICSNLKEDEIRIRIKKELGYVKESFDGNTVEKIKESLSKMIDSIQNSFPEDSKLSSIIEKATTDVNNIIIQNKELNLFRGKEILRSFYEQWIKNQVGTSYYSFCMELAKQVASDQNHSQELSKVVKKINSKFEPLDKG